MLYTRNEDGKYVPKCTNPVKQIAKAPLDDVIIRAIQVLQLNYADSPSLECGCKPCMRLCYDKDSLLEEIVGRAEAVQEAIKILKGEL